MNGSRFLPVTPWLPSLCSGARGPRIDRSWRARQRVSNRPVRFVGLGLFLILHLLAPTREAAARSSKDLVDLSLEEILNIPVVSVSKTEKPLLEQTVSAAVVTRSQIRERGYRDLLDVLRDLPGIHIVDLTNSEHAASEVLVRGIDANTKMLFLLDGEKISSPTGEPFTFLRNIPLIAVKQIELSYGAAASLYGPDAIAGIVNVVTESHDDEEGRGTEAWIGAGSHSTYEAQARHRFELTSEASLSVTGAFYSSSQQDLASAYPKTFGAFDVDPSLDSHSFHARLEAGGITASFLRLYGSRNNGLGFLPALYDYSGGSTWDTTNNFWNLSWSYGSKTGLRGRSVVTYSRTELEPTSSYSYDFTGSREFEDHSFYWRGRSTRLKNDVQWVSERVTWLTGAEFEWLESIPKTDIDYPLGSYDIFYRNLGAFTQVEIEAASWASLTAGVRYDNDSRFPHQWNPRVGAAFRLADGLRSHLSWGTAYLAPSPHKQYERWGVIAEGEFVHLPNPELQPESSETADAGIDWFPTERSRLTVSGFHTRATDLWRIEFRGPTVVDGTNVVYQTNANVAESSIHGFHVGADYQLWSHLSFSGHYTFTGGTQDGVSLDETVQLNHMPRHLYQLGADWHLAGRTARIVGRGFDDVTSNGANSELAGASIAGTWTADLFLEQELPFSQRDVRLGLDVRNVFDRSYEKISKFDEFFFALPTTPQPRRTIAILLRASL